MIYVIDTHVHCRDEEQSEKETIEHALGVARDSGVVAVFDMPNTARPVMSLERARDRLKLAEKAQVREVFYGTYLGLTSDKEQIKFAVDAYKSLFPRIVGFKLYAGHSVGNLGVVEFEEQAVVYETLSSVGYDGVLFVHSEKESEMNNNLFNPRNPISHCLARPEKAEIESVRDQIYLAKHYNFPGKLHIAHISSPIAVSLVNRAKKEGLDISCGVCPHHIIYDWDQMGTPEGIMFKMNPPLRKPGSRDKLLNMLRSGLIDWIETDHAPHTLGQKMGEGNLFMSGITGLEHWQLFIEYLRSEDFSDRQIEDLVFNNAAKRFGIDFKKTKRPILSRKNDYPYNAYAQLEDILRK